MAPDLVALATTITTVAVVGPYAAGLVADRTGSFAPIFLIVGALFVVALGATLLLRREPVAMRPPGSRASTLPLDPAKS